MKYRSKTDLSLVAQVYEVDEKRKTTSLEYLTGEEKGKTICITNPTLKRWWTPIDDEALESDDSGLKFVPKKKPKYVPKPPAVVEYEERRAAKINNNELPSFHEVANIFAEALARAQARSKYVMFHDGTTLWRKTHCIDVYANTDTAEKLVKSGLKAKPNKDRFRPFHIRLENKVDYEKAEAALLTIKKEEEA